MVALQRLASRLWPSGGHHPGGLGWALAIDELYPQLQLAFDGEELVGWAGRSTRAFEVHVDPAAPDAVRPLVEWALENAAADEPVSFDIFHGDDARPRGHCSGRFFSRPNMSAALRDVPRRRSRCTAAAIRLPDQRT
jgi:hypothetical protein